MVKVWVLLALLAASLEPVAAKIGYGGKLDPWQLLSMKNLVAAGLILPVTGRWRWLGWARMPALVGVSLLLLITSAATLWALRLLPAVVVITLITATPASVALLNQWLGRERLTRKFWLGLAACLLGTVLSLNPLDKQFEISPLGLLAVLLAILSSTVYRTRLETVTQEISPMLVSTYIFLINGLVSALVLWPVIRPIEVSAYPIGLWVGAAAALANVAFLSALKELGSTNVSLFNLLQRPLVLVAAALILHEPLSWLQGLGMGLVLSGVKLAQLPARGR